MKRAICFLVLLFLARLSMADELFSPLFHSMPTKAKGQVFVAKALFSDANDGLWVQDHNRQLLFFDGHNVLPFYESTVFSSPLTLAFLNHAFWSFAGHEVYRFSPGQPEELVFSLSPASEINNIGVSGRNVWVADETGFYTYQVDSKDFASYSLDKLDRYSQFSKLKINDAELIGDNWIVATNVGLYMFDSNNKNLHDLRRYGNENISVLHYSSVRHELVVGSDSGSFILDMQDLDLPSRKISDRGVLSVAETPKGYWIANNTGLELFIFRGTYAGETKSIEQFSGQKVHSVLYNDYGEVWVASDSGIYSFSEPYYYFNRLPDYLFNLQSTSSKLLRLKYANQKDSYWLVTDSGLYKLNLGNPASRAMLFEGKIKDVVEHNGVLWLATDENIVGIDSSSGDILSDGFPSFFNNLSADLLTIDVQGRIWGASVDRIWRLNISNGELLQFGSDWMSHRDQDSQLEQISVDNNDKLVLGTDHGVYVVDRGQVYYMTESQPFGAIVSMTHIDEGIFGVAGRFGAFLLDTNRLSLEELSLMSANMALNCLSNAGGYLWLTSSIGLTRYSRQGQLVEHYAIPSGHIHYEPQAGLCAIGGASKHGSILLDFNDTVISTDIAKLINSTAPKIRIVLSEVAINQNRHSIGGLLEPLHTKFGDSLSFQFGILPYRSHFELEYRLNEKGRWMTLPGQHLTLVHPMPGHYVIEVRAVSNGQIVANTEKFVFSVDVPWYLGEYAILCYLVLFFVLILSLINWSSRMTARTNKILKSQIALKTNQLRHQSRILLTNNERLRKQLQVRRIIYRQLIEALKERMKSFSSNIRVDDHKGKQRLYKYVNHELDLLLNYRAMSSGTLPTYSLPLIVKSVLDGWQDELNSAEIVIKTDLEQRDDSYITLYISNLDRVFNLLIDNLIRRCSKGQEIGMTYRLEKESVIFSMSEPAQHTEGALLRFPEVWNEIGTLVMESGGSFRRYSSQGLQLTEFVWPKDNQLEENSIDQMIDSGLENSQADDRWIKKLQELVIQNYSDSEFGTAAAAKQMYMSERSLQRRFKSATERTFTEYLTEIRLDHACRRLLAGQKVSDVAFECGFNDPSYFSQRFRHRFGVSPTQFIEAQG